jgi:hypothetical protein
MSTLCAGLVSRSVGKRVAAWAIAVTYLANSLLQGHPMASSSSWRGQGVGYCARCASLVSEGRRRSVPRASIRRARKINERNKTYLIPWPGGMAGGGCRRRKGNDVARLQPRVGSGRVGSKERGDA